MIRIRRSDLISAIPPDDFHERPVPQAGEATTIVAASGSATWTFSNASGSDRQIRGREEIGAMVPPY